MGDCGTLEIDGSYLEGGGQILRIALSLSCILRRPIKIINIRANRPVPGLSNQHLYGLNLLVDITDARVRGNSVQSTEVEFSPGAIKSGHYTVNPRTAASISLILQVALPVLLFARNSSTLTLSGGTNVGMAPPIDYISEVLKPNLAYFGIMFDIFIHKRGYYPRGGGLCKVSIHTVPMLKSITLTEYGELEKVNCRCYVAGKLPLYLAEEMKSAIDREFENVFEFHQVEIESYKEPTEMARDNGSGVLIKATSSEGCTLGSSALGEKKINPKELGLAAAKEIKYLIDNKNCVDFHAQDQLIIYMALAEGESRIQTCKLTNHALTAIHVVELMTGVKFKIEEVDEHHVILVCKGIGHQYNSL